MIDNKISIITSTYQAEKHISKLIKSLIYNEKHIHEWIIIDNISTDLTIPIIKKNKFKFKINIIKKRTSIYEAFNEGIKSLTSDFYMIFGADDSLLNDGIKNFFNITSLKSDISLYILPTFINGKVVNKKSKKKSILGASHLINSHSAGLIINKIVHEQVGLYSTEYDFASDSDFIIKIFKRNMNIERVSIPVGCFGVSGSSNKNINLKKILIENYLIMIRNNFSIFNQSIILILRFVKNFLRFL